ncbi:MAG: hypothetical protein Q9162_003700 [Coniocarpon cinnabarinum]
MASSTYLPPLDDDDPPQPDSPSLPPSSAKRLSYRPPVPPKDPHQSRSPVDLHPPPQYRPPASPRFHQRNFTDDHYQPSTFASPRVPSQFSPTHDHSGSIDTALRIGYHPQSLTPDPNNDQSSDRAVSVRDLDFFHTPRPTDTAINPTINAVHNFHTPGPADTAINPIINDNFHTPRPTDGAISPTTNATRNFHTNILNLTIPTTTTPNNRDIPFLSPMMITTER